MKILLQNLGPYFRRYRWLLIGGVVFIVLSNLFSIYPAQVVQNAIDLVSDLAYLHTLTKGYAAQAQVYEVIGGALLLFAGLVVGMSFIRGVFLFLVRQTMIVMSRKIEYEQKKEIYRHYQEYSLSILRRARTGDLMSRITEDVGNVRMFTGPGIMYTLNTGVLFVLVFVTMLAVNVELTLYVLAPFPLLCVTIYFVHKIIIRRSEQVQAQLSQLTSFVQETFSGVRLVKAYAREHLTYGRYVEESSLYKEKALNLVKIDALFFPIIVVLIGLSNIFIVWIGGEKVIAGTLTIGNIAEFLIYVNLLVMPVAALGWVTSLIQKAAASQIRINEVMAWRSELIFPAASPAIDAPDVEFVHVGFTYIDTGIHALENVSFSLKAGQTLGVIGLTGSGKTTLANLTFRLMDVTEGEIRLGGQPLQSWSQEALSGGMAYVPQDVFLFSDTIRGNIAFGRDNAPDEDVRDAARFAGVLEDILGFPQQFDTIVGERGVTLSGGQKQRISIARAYLMRSKLLILDDSLSAVDTRTEEEILTNLRSHVSDVKPTLILITHRISTIQNADKIIVLDHGRIIEEGTHDELLKRQGLYHSLHQKQRLEEEMKTLNA